LLIKNNHNLHDMVPGQRTPKGLGQNLNPTTKMTFNKGS
jgi:hypothetical protein